MKLGIFEINNYKIIMLKNDRWIKSFQYHVIRNLFVSLGNDYKCQ
jgi:hypothetical protein